jgi:hypothetical protein
MLQLTASALGRERKRERERTSKRVGAGEKGRQATRVDQTGSPPPIFY